MSAVVLPQGPVRLSPFATTGVLDADPLGVSGVFLRPGDWLWGQGCARVSTLLGSCVALVLWSQRLQLGAMCHCLLPQRPGGEGPQPADGRYADETCQWFEQRFAEAGCSLRELQISLAGGAGAGRGSIGQSNIAWAHHWAERRGLAFEQQDVGGRVVRRLTFNLADGCLTVAHGGRFGGD